MRSLFHFVRGCSTSGPLGRSMFAVCIWNQCRLPTVIKMNCRTAALSLQLSSSTSASSFLPSLSRRSCSLPTISPPARSQSPAPGRPDDKRHPPAQIQAQTQVAPRQLAAQKRAPPFGEPPEVAIAFRAMFGPVFSPIRLAHFSADILFLGRVSRSGTQSVHERDCFSDWQATGERLASEQPVCAASLQLGSSGRQDASAAGDCV